MSAGQNTPRVNGLIVHLTSTILIIMTTTTIIIIITVVLSGSAYLCFLKYVCAGCCKPTQVAPTLTSDPNKVEEQV